MTKLTALEQLHNFPDDLQMSINAHLFKAMSCDNILLCGMGGSGISNAIAYDCFYQKTKFVKIVRTPILPKWANNRTLAIISSYSGNTRETLEMYQNAMERGCKIIVITGGGKLKELAEEHKQITYSLPSGMDPRHAIGYMAGFIFAISRDVGGADITETVSSVIPNLRRFVKKMERPMLSNARTIAKNLLNKTTIVFYTKDVESAALRWKSQISENAKLISIAEPIEFFDPKNKYDLDDKTSIVIITTDKARAAEIEKMATKKKIYCKLVKVDQKKYVQRLFESIILGDFVSVYMAEMESVDPRDVAPITKLKQKMSDRL